MARRQIKIKDIAKAAGVSLATVSQAFNHPREVNRKTRQKILEISNQLGYIRESAGKKRHRNIAVLAMDRYIPFTDFYSWVSVGIIEEAQKHGFNIIIEPFLKNQDELPRVVSKNIVDGILVLGPLSREHILMLKQRNIPLVLCGHPTPGLELHTVLPDGRAGMYEATKRLLNLGHKKIAFITGGPVFDPVAADRLEGFRFAMFEAGLEIPKEYIVQADLIKYQTAHEAAEKQMGLDNPPTAMICISDPIAYIIYDYLTKKGVKIPKELSLIGFDDLPSTFYTSPFLPELTTVHVDVENLGKTAVKVLLDVIENPSATAYRHTLPVRLIEKKSTAPPKK
jgi:LacI family transcriptional regulator